MKYALIAIATLLLTGCVGTRVTKEIQVHRDAQGKVIKTVKIERAVQGGSMVPFSFEYLKCKKGDKECPIIYH